MSSSYCLTLDAVVKKRYWEKLDGLGVQVADPYLDDGTCTWQDDVRGWPSLEFADIYVYLIDTPAPFTRQKLHAYRSLEAYSFYVNGWVQTCLHRRYRPDVCFVKAKVMRSQATTEKPHEAWVAIRETDSSVAAAHCTCMAG